MSCSTGTRRRSRHTRRQRSTHCWSSLVGSSRLIGGIADRGLVAVTVASLVATIWATFRLGARVFGPWPGAAAAHVRRHQHVAPPLRRAGLCRHSVPCSRDVGRGAGGGRAAQGSRGDGAARAGGAAAPGGVGAGWGLLALVQDGGGHARACPPARPGRGGASRLGGGGPGVHRRPPALAARDVRARGRAQPAPRPGASASRLRVVLGEHVAHPGRHCGRARSGTRLGGARAPRSRRALRSARCRHPHVRGDRRGGAFDSAALPHRPGSRAVPLRRLRAIGVHHAPRRSGPPAVGDRRSCVRGGGRGRGRAAHPLAGSPDGRVALRALHAPRPGRDPQPAGRPRGAAVWPGHVPDLPPRTGRPVDPRRAALPGGRAQRQAPRTGRRDLRGGDKPLRRYGFADGASPSTNAPDPGFVPVARAGMFVAYASCPED